MVVDKYYPTSYLDMCAICTCCFGVINDRLNDDNDDVLYIETADFCCVVKTNALSLDYGAAKLQ